MENNTDTRLLTLKKLEALLYSVKTAESTISYERENARMFLNLGNISAAAKCTVKARQLSQRIVKRNLEIEKLKLEL